MDADDLYERDLWAGLALWLEIGDLDGDAGGTVAYAWRPGDPVARFGGES